MKDLTRREFLGVTAVAAMGGLSQPLIGNWIEESLVSHNESESLPAVSVAKGSVKDSAAEILKTAIEGLGGIKRFVKSGQTVAIKPNATWAYPPKTASSTDPDLLAAVINLVRDAGAKRIIVMDHCSIDPGTSECLRVSGIGAMVDKMGVEKLFPDRFDAPRSTYTQIELPEGQVFKKIGVIKAAVEADVRINMALAKSHLVTRYTICLKHMMGFLEMPGYLHADLEKGIAEINTPSPIQAQLHILEAIRVRLPTPDNRQAGGFETDQTHPNKVKRMNQIVVGVDPVLMDSYACIEYFSINPQELAHVRRAYEIGLGEIDLLKAANAGLLKIFSVGVPLTSPTPSATLTKPVTPTAIKSDQTVTPSVISTPSTATPQPTAEPLPTSNSPVEISTISENVDPVISPNKFLSGALIPAAAVVAGVGVVVARRLNKQKDDPDESNDKQSK